MTRICVVGTWHQASIVSACFADMGHQVFGVGDDPNEIESLNTAKPLVHEPKLQAIMRRNLRAGRLRYTTNYTQALQGAEFAYIAMDTPVDLDDESDLTPMRALDSSASVCCDCTTRSGLTAWSSAFWFDLQSWHEHLASFQFLDFRLNALWAPG